MTIKVAIVTLAFDNPLRVERCIERLKSTNTDGLEIEHFLIDLGYPLPDKQDNTEDLFLLCKKHGLFYMKTENRGQDGNIRHLENMITLKRFDAIVFWDTDSNPDLDTWLIDAVAVLKAKTYNCLFVTINCRDHHNSLQMQHPSYEINGIPVADLKWPGAWPMFIMSPRFWDTDFQPTHSFYGGSEPNILAAINKAGGVGVMMREHNDSRNLEHIDPEYVAWKHWAIDKQDALSFEAWLEERRKDETKN